jgi:hypothetical protein
MGLKLITPPAVEPVLLADAKAFLRVSVTTDDALISSFITAARQYCEGYLGRQLINATYKFSFDTFPLYSGTQFPWPFLQQVPVAGAYQLGTYYMSTPNLGILSPVDRRKLTWPNVGNIALPKPSLQSVTSIQYMDVNNTLQTWDPSNYQVITDNDPGYILPLQSYPTVSSTAADGVQITYVAGYGPDGTSVPGTIAIAIKLMLAGWYETRSPSTVAAGVEQAVHSLLSQYVFEGNV